MRLGGFLRLAAKTLNSCVHIRATATDAGNHQNHSVQERECILLCGLLFQAHPNRQKQTIQGRMSIPLAPCFVRTGCSRNFADRRCPLWMVRPWLWPCIDGSTWMAYGPSEQCKLGRSMRILGLTRANLATGARNGSRWLHTIPRSISQPRLQACKCS